MLPTVDLPFSKRRCVGSSTPAKANFTRLPFRLVLDILKEYFLLVVPMHMFVYTMRSPGDVRRTCGPCRSTGIARCQMTRRDYFGYFKYDRFRTLFTIFGSFGMDGCPDGKVSLGTIFPRKVFYLDITPMGRKHFPSDNTKRGHRLS